MQNLCLDPEFGRDPDYVDKAKEVIDYKIYTI
jgi:hypothetical protein